MYLGSVGSYIPIIGIPIPGWMAIPLESHVTWPWHNWSHGQLEDKLGRNPLYYALGNPVPEEQWEILPLGGGYPVLGPPKFDNMGLQQSTPLLTFMSWEAATDTEPSWGIPCCWGSVVHTRHRVSQQGRGLSLKVKGFVLSWEICFFS
jgi:hypothetical protein